MTLLENKLARYTQHTRPVADSSVATARPFHLECNVEPLSNRENLSLDLGPPASEKRLIVVDSQAFFHECIQRYLETALTLPVQVFSSISELSEQAIASGSVRLLMIFLADSDPKESAHALDMLANFARLIPSVILSSRHDLAMMRAVMSYGAKAYIPMNMGFGTAIEVVRFVLAGGTYVPAEFLLAAGGSAAPPPPHVMGGGITQRELTVIKAIQQGKPNKTIAYELNLCESTVKVHVRQIMKKLRVKNRTEVAIKSVDLLSCGSCFDRSGCWSAARCLKKSL